MTLGEQRRWVRVNYRGPADSRKREWPEAVATPENGAETADSGVESDGEPTYTGRHGEPPFDQVSGSARPDVPRGTGPRVTTVLAVTNQKGGVGKTTTAISLGTALAQAGARVLIVDLDPQGNATSGLGMSKEHPNAVYGMLLRDASPQEAIVQTSVQGLDLVPSSRDMAGAEVELVPALAREWRLRTALDRLSGYDTILIDCPPSLGLLTVNALVAADAALIPVQCEYFALEGLAQLLSTIDAVRARLNQRLEVLAIVLTMDDKRNRLSMQVVEELHRHFPQLVARVRIPRTVRLAEAPSHGVPIQLYDPASRAAAAYGELATEISARIASRQPIALGGAMA
jgi:chromosome partitioning protein